MQGMKVRKITAFWRIAGSLQWPSLPITRYPKQESTKRTSAADRICRTIRTAISISAKKDAAYTPAEDTTGRLKVVTSAKKRYIVVTNAEWSDWSASVWSLKFETGDSCFIVLKNRKKQVTDIGIFDLVVNDLFFCWPGLPHLTKCDSPFSILSC